MIILYILYTKVKKSYINDVCSFIKVWFNSLENYLPEILRLQQCKISIYLNMIYKVI